MMCNDWMAHNNILKLYIYNLKLAAEKYCVGSSQMSAHYWEHVFLFCCKPRPQSLRETHSHTQISHEYWIQSHALSIGSNDHSWECSKTETERLQTDVYTGAQA